MKALITLILVSLIVTKSISQEKNIETQSVSIENLIPFVVDNYTIRQDADLATKNITFLIQIPGAELDAESKIVLKQAFKLLSNRLTEDDNISMVTYSGFSGIALKQTSPKDLKKILYTINNFKSSVKEFHKDGIELAYNYTNENFDEDAINSVVMVRNPNTSSGVNAYNSSSSVKPPKKKNNAVLITAISLLPELIAIIKN
ncbi:MAG: hypothetical protein L3J25_08685 [Flavobacteriaceae bacterium]|nr:hypothetical protein [Flavobacteriaceae bacterium]